MVINTVSYCVMCKKIYRYCIQMHVLGELGVDEQAGCRDWRRWWHCDDVCTADSSQSRIRYQCYLITGTVTASKITQIATATLTYKTSCAARWPPQYAPAPPWLLTFWPWSRCGSRMWPGVPLCKVSSSYRPFGWIKLIRQTDGRTDRRMTDADDRLMPPPPLRGRGIINKRRWKLSLDTFLQYFRYIT